MMKVARTKTGMVVRKKVLHEKRLMLSFIKGPVGCPYCHKTVDRLYRCGYENSFPWACKDCINWLFATIK